MSTMVENTGLSSEQRAVLDEFKAVSGLDHDMCMDILQQYHWDLQDALQHAAALSPHNNNNDSQPLLQHNRQDTGNCCTKLLKAIGILPRNDNTGIPADTFINQWETLYGHAHPQFVNSNFQQALNTATAQNKLLFLYLHSEDHDDTHSFCTTTLARPDVVQYIDEHCVPYGASIKEYDGYRLSRHLKVETYPFACLLSKLNGQLVVRGRQDGFAPPDQFYRSLLEAHQEIEELSASTRSVERVYSSAAEIVQEQDREYEEALARDRAREEAEEQKRMKLFEEQKQREYEEMKRQEALRKIEEEIAAKARVRLDKLNSLGKEPDAGPSVFTIQFRLPNGKSIRRRFHGSDSLQVLATFVESHELLDVDGNEISHWEFMMNYPRQTYCRDSELSVSSAGIPDQTVLMDENALVSGSVWEVGGECNAISISPTRELIAVAGRDVLKVTKVNNSTRTFTGPVKNLRTGNPQRLNLTYASNDVRWNKNYQYRHLICTAATNGKIIIWNVDKVGSAKQERIYDEHARTVNRVCWHTSNPVLVLSASQDSSVKLWDIRETNSQQTMQSKAGPSRDVMWCPTNPYKFAVAFDSGVVQIWDVREPSNFEMQLSSHHRDPVLTLAWHPVKENVLASGSRDKMIKIWDLSDNVRTPVAEVQTIQSVARIKWRPHHSTQLASCSVLFDYRIHIWDYEAPYMPIASFVGHKDVVTGFVWGSGSGEEIVSCSKDSTARFFSVAEDAYLPQKHLKVGAATWNGSNSLSFIDDRLKEDSIGGKISQDSEHGIVSTVLNSSPLINDHLSTNYKLRIDPDDPKLDSLTKVCEHNSTAARHEGLDMVAGMWKTLACLFESDDMYSSQVADTFEAVVEDLPSQKPANHRRTITQESHEESVDDIGDYDPFDLTSVIPVRYEEQPAISQDHSRASSMDIGGKLLPSPREHNQKIRITGLPKFSGKYFREDINGHFWSLKSCFKDELLRIREHTVQSILECYAEQGDLQTCVTLLLFLQNCGHSVIPAAVSRRYLISYLEILQRNELWQHATEIIRSCPDPQDRSMNQKSTAISVASRCRECNKMLDLPIGQGYSSSCWVKCDKCGPKLIRCALCRLPVSGAYLWCQGCGHGGHLRHMYKWFQTNSTCPAGCMHLCNPTVVANH